MIATFSQQLKAAAALPDLVHALAIAHWQYEGWTPREAGNDDKRFYQAPAEIAVGYASTVVRECALNAASQFAEAAWERVTDDESRRIFVCELVETYLHYLRQQPGMSRAESEVYGE